LTTVSVIEDDRHYRAGLEVLIGNSEDFSLLHSYASAEEALAHILQHPPDIAIVDIKLPGQNGIELIKKLREKDPGILCMVCSYYDDNDYVFTALKNGASGYILKDSQPSAIIESLRELKNGGAPMSRYIARKVISAFHEKKALPHLSVLTDRENEVLQLVADGLLIKEVSDRLDISNHTVKSHLKHIYTKLHVNNKIEAINKLNDRG
jgi:DNA-binding NarL/FixJ family response regulator